MKRFLPLAAAILLLSPTALPASPKPCVGPNGKVIKCPKKPAPPRCKDDKGRFTCAAKAKS